MWEGLLIFFYEVGEMPQVRKIIRVGESRAISLPKSWLDFQKRKCGQEIREVLMEESNQSLVISPIAPGKESKS
jgi:antitoxin component of MazEF toxin-antitoxin module